MGDLLSHNSTIRRPVTITEEVLLGLIAELNADDGVDGILVQLPLPASGSALTTTAVCVWSLCSLLVRNKFWLSCYR